MEYYVELMDIKGTYDSNRSAIWCFESYEKATEIARSIRGSLINSEQKGFLVMVKNSINQVLSFKVLR